MPTHQFFQYLVPNLVEMCKLPFYWTPQIFSFSNQFGFTCWRWLAKNTEKYWYFDSTEEKFGGETVPENHHGRMEDWQLQEFGLVSISNCYACFTHLTSYLDACPPMWLHDLTRGMALVARSTAIHSCALSVYSHQCHDVMCRLSIKNQTIQNARCQTTLSLLSIVVLMNIPVTGTQYSCLNLL